eukprot:1191830-Prorocentrum_minimum.AAC.2
MTHVKPFRSCQARNRHGRTFEKDFDFLNAAKGFGYACAIYVDYGEGCRYAPHFGCAFDVCFGPTLYLRAFHPYRLTHATPLFTRSPTHASSPI